MRPVLHDKSKKVYLYIQEITDATNSENNKVMVLYSNLDGHLFVREKSEFWYKFSAIDSDSVYYIDKKRFNEKEIKEKITT